MADFLCRTRGNSDPQGKPRVYFTCHPDDLHKYFDKLCEDIFNTHDCAIYYTEDMSLAFDALTNEPVSELDVRISLGRMNLFIVPVTFKLLSTPNRAMDTDISYAKTAGIPILPFMMESGIDEIYSKPENFGKRQYLEPYSTDITAISYESKLERYLNSALINDETAQRVRNAFDAYIFLSYRKKDRRYANELMRLIHSYPEFRDLAIWYDEFLTPGESFQKNIEKMLEKSKLFTLLVTPSLLEYVNGQPNYVMEHEYPDAKAAGMPILPAEMVNTDKTELSDKYKDIPDCVDPKDNLIFRSSLADPLSRLSVFKCDDSPEHLFLMGLAYLDGVDTETDRERGIALITAAAEADYPEAIKKLFSIYDDGVHLKKALLWAKRIAEYCEEQYGKEAPATLSALNQLARVYESCGAFDKAFEIYERIYTLRRRVSGEEHPDTLTVLGNLAAVCLDMGKNKYAMTLHKRSYELQCRVLGEEHPDTLISLNNLGAVYNSMGEYKKALETHEKAYSLICRIFGEEHPNTLTSLHNQALCYSELGEHKKALEIQKRVYAARCRVIGEEHPYTLSSLEQIAVSLRRLGDVEKALEILQRVYELKRKVLGEKHPHTVVCMGKLFDVYRILKKYGEALDMALKAYSDLTDSLGIEHPQALAMLNNISYIYHDAGDHQKCSKILERACELSRKVLGEEHPDTLTSLNNLAICYCALNRLDEAKELLERVYALKCKVLGETHKKTVDALKGLIYVYQRQNCDSLAAELSERLRKLSEDTSSEE